MRTARLAVLAASLAACGKAEPAGSPACPHSPGADRSGLVEVTTVFPPAVLRRDLDLAGLAAQAGDAMDGRPQGLTEVSHQVRFRSLVNAETADGRTCVWLDRVGIDLTPASVQIFIPKEYPDGSCEYAAILAHEREHERVSRELLLDAADEIRAALGAASWLPGRGNPMEIADRPGDRAAAEAQLDAKIRKVVMPVYDAYKKKLGPAQADLDRPDLYRWTTKRCSGWK